MNNISGGGGNHPSTVGSGSTGTTPVLLGQLKVTGRLSTNALLQVAPSGRRNGMKMMYDKSGRYILVENMMPEEEEENGTASEPNSSRSSTSTVPLLASTLKLIGLLGQDEIDNLEGLYFPVGKNAGTTDESMLKGNDSMDVSEIDEDDEDAPSSSGEAASSTTSRNLDAPTTEEKDKTHPAFQHFQRVSNMTGAIEAAIHDLRQLRERDYEAAPRQPRQSYNDRRRIALEKQREGLQNKLQESSSDQKTSDSESEDTDEWMLLVKAHNSLQRITPLLLKIFFHPHRNDHSLVINGDKIATDKADSKKKEGRRRREEKRAQCWLLGDNTYDVVSVRLAKRIYQDLRTLWILYFGFNLPKGLTPLTKEQVNDCIKSSIHQMQSVMPFLAEWERKVPVAHCFDKVPIKERDSLITLTRLLDEQCGLLEEKNSEDEAKYLKAVRKLQKRITELITKRFPGGRLSVYGSSLSGISLNSSDVDLSLYVKRLVDLKADYESGSKSVKRYEQEMKNAVYTVCRLLEHNSKEFRGLNPVARARVPVVNGNYILAENPYSADGSLHFDVCFLNDIAVANSNLIKQYTLVDPRVRQLMVAIKRWAKANDISSSKDQALSSYAWMILVIFYLQNIGFVPNLQSKALLNRVKRTGDKYWDNVNNLDTAFLSWEEVSQIWKIPDGMKDTSVFLLFHGFFDFYSTIFPSSVYMVSISRVEWKPKTCFRRSSAFLCIEDPFELYDSHVPHDLTLPVGEKNQSKIMLLICKQKEFLDDVMKNVKDNPDVLAEYSNLWPTLEVPDAHSSDQQGKTTADLPTKEISKPIDKVEPSTKQKRGKKTRKVADQSTNKSAKADTSEKPGSDSKDSPEIQSPTPELQNGETIEGQVENNKNSGQQPKNDSKVRGRRSRRKGPKNAEGSHQSEALPDLQSAQNTTKDTKVREEPVVDSSVPETGTSSKVRSSGRGDRGGRGRNRGRGRGRSRP